MAYPKEFCKNGHKMSITRKFGPDGDSYCSECQKNKKPTPAEAENNKIRLRKYRKEKPEALRATRLKYRYKTTPEYIDFILQSQNNRCAICGGTEWGGPYKKPCIDHDHNTGMIRGILCNSCNLGISFLKDNPQILISATKYLKRSGKK